MFLRFSNSRNIASANYFRVTKPGNGDGHWNHSQLHADLITFNSCFFGHRSWAEGRRRNRLQNQRRRAGHQRPRHQRPRHSPRCCLVPALFPKNRKRSGPGKEILKITRLWAHYLSLLDHRQRECLFPRRRHSYEH